MIQDFKAMGNWKISIPARFHVQIDVSSSLMQVQQSRNYLCFTPEFHLLYAFFKIEGVVVGTFRRY